MYFRPFGAHRRLGALVLPYDRHAHVGVLRILVDSSGSGGLFGSRSGIIHGRRSEMT